MFSIITQTWNTLTGTGTAALKTEREKHDVQIFNRTWIVILLIQVICLASHLFNGLNTAAITTAWFIAGLCCIYPLVKRGRVNKAKMLAIILISIDTSVNAVVFGEHTHVVDFLLLAALTPLYFFEIKNKNLILAGISVCLLPFAAYHFTTPYVVQYALPLAIQLKLYQLLTWEKGFCLVVLLYLMYHKNAAYAKEMLDKEAELVRQKKLYESILEQIPIDIVTMDKDLKYTYVNSAAVKDAGIRRWLIGKTNVDYFKFRNLDLKGALERERMMTEALQTGIAVEFEETFIDKDGHSKYSMKGVSPIVTDKEVSGLVGYAFNITEIKEAEKKLKEYSAELERKNDELHHFVNATSHDLKSPLRNIASHLQLLLRRNAGKLDEESIGMVAFTIKSVKQLNQLISDIYQYSVADRNDKPIEMADLNQILDSSLKQMEDFITSKGAQIKHTNLPILKVAPSHMNMLFSNLVGNAVKYNTALKPEVTISAKVTEKEYILSVSDNGIGIAEEYQQQIFEIFQRLHTSSEYEGTGVGLAICSKIVDNYRGKIWVESEKDKGSTFYFTLDREMVESKMPESHNIIPYKNMAKAV